MLQWGLAIKFPLWPRKHKHLLACLYKESLRRNWDGRLDATRNHLTTKILSKPLHFKQIFWEKTLKVNSQTMQTLQLKREEAGKAAWSCWALGPAPGPKQILRKEWVKELHSTTLPPWTSGMLATRDPMIPTDIWIGRGNCPEIRQSQSSNLCRTEKVSWCAETLQ